MSRRGLKTVNLLPLFIVFAMGAHAGEPAIIVQVEPAQSVNAFTVTASDGSIHSLPVRDGKTIAPPDVPFPWTISLNRFEPLAYTKTDFEQRKPLLLREYGEIAGTIAPRPKQGETFAILLKPSVAGSVAEIELTPRSDGTFSFRNPAGVYHGAIVGNQRASRLRSGIVVNPGKKTDVGALQCDPTVQVSVRVMDAKRGKPLPRATLQWDPTGVLSADVAKALYGKRWSGVTDSRGIATFTSIGPVPVPVRWRVDARGFAATHTPQVLVSDKQSVALSDVRLRPEAAITAHVTIVRDSSKLKDASLTLGEVQDPTTMQIVPVSRTQLREGDIVFRSETYGPKRLTIADFNGKPVMFRDFYIDSESTRVELRLEPIEVRGTVTRKDKGVENAGVWLTDPRDGTFVLEHAITDDDGRYELSTFQVGELLLHATMPHKDGINSGGARLSFKTDERREYFADLKFPEWGRVFKVVDAESGAPVRATAAEKVTYKGGGALMGRADSDDQGLIVLTDHPEGAATLTFQARGYKSAELTMPLETSPAETIVRLEKAEPLRGRVVDERGLPIGGARIKSGFKEGRGSAVYYQITDGDGNFHFDSPPENGSTFYVTAPGRALGIAALYAGRPNVITLGSPSPGVISVMPDNAPPTKVYTVAAAPRGGDYIPGEILYDLAEMNGLHPYSLYGNSRDGTVVLPEFLPPGQYDFFISSGDQSYQRIGSVALPSKGNMVLAFKLR